MRASDPCVLALLSAGAVGKSALIQRFLTDEFLDVWDPTIEDSYRRVVSVGGKLVLVHLLDTNGHDEYRALLASWTAQSQGVIIVYDVTRRVSFNQVAPIYRRVLAAASTAYRLPGVVVGNFADLEHDRAVTENEGRTLAGKLGLGFIETSARTGHNVQEMFALAVEEVLHCIDSVVHEQRRALASVPATQFQRRRALSEQLKRLERRQSLRDFTLELRARQTVFQTPLVTVAPCTLRDELEWLYREARASGWTCVPPLPATPLLLSSEVSEADEQDTLASSRRSSTGSMRGLKGVDGDGVRHSPTSMRPRGSSAGSASMASAPESIVEVLDDPSLLAVRLALRPNVDLVATSGPDTASVFRVHHVVVAARCPVLLRGAQRAGDRWQVRVALEPRAVDQVVRYLYTGAVEVASSLELAALGRATRALGLHELSLSCALAAPVLQDNEQLGMVGALAVRTNAQTFTDNLRDLLRSGTGTDVTFLVEGQRIGAHRAILILRSPYFQTLFKWHLRQHGGAEHAFVTPIQLGEVSREDFRRVLEYAYTGQVRALNAATAGSLLVVAGMYALDRLVQLCELELQRVIRTPAEAIDAVVDADSHDARQLVEHCVHLLASEFRSICHQRAFLQLPVGLRRRVLVAYRRQGAATEQTRHVSAS